MKTYNFGETPKKVILEALGNKRYPCALIQPDAELMKEAVNRGIDSHLEAVTDSTFTWDGHRLHCDISPKDLLVILRRLSEAYDKDGDIDACYLRTDILQTLEIEEE